MTKRKKWFFKNHATTIRVVTLSQGFAFRENQCKEFSLWERGVFPTYAACVKALQRYSRNYYGEKAS